MTETREVNTEEEGGDLIPKEQLPSAEEITKQAQAGGGSPKPEEEPEEKEEQPESEEAPESSPEAPAEKPEEPSQPAPVEGETPTEKARRLEIERLRGLLRKKQSGELVQEVANPPVTKEDEYKALKDAGYTDEQIQAMETAIDVIASKKGYVRADRNYAQSVQDTVDLFTDSHPEYKPSNDKDDIRWNLFQEKLKDGTYNLHGKTPKQLTAIFERVDADVRKELGEPVTMKANPKQVAAQQHKVKVVSQSAGGTKTVQSEKPKQNPTQVGGIKLVGFDESDFEG